MKTMYGYDEKVREKAEWLQAEVMVKILELPLLDKLKRVDHILLVNEVLRLNVDKDKMFRELDRVGITCPLGPPMSPSTG